MMRLPTFIVDNIEQILSEWESFARSVWPTGVAAEPHELRDHAREILSATVADMGSVQTLREQAEKSRGHADDRQDSELLSASEEHGSGRVASGFGLRALIAEYRALRASVLSLWRASVPSPDARDIEDIIRFNESIDQSLARAVSSFTARIDRSRQMFLAILGHDLRNPLAAINISAQALQMMPSDLQRASLLDGTRRSVNAMSRMISDLLDYAATGLGGSIPVHLAPVDLGDICREVATEARAAHPTANIRVEACDDCTGRWDAQRLRQVFSNLLGNALQHGDPSLPIEMRFDSDKEHVHFAVTNGGEPIPSHKLATIFEPLVSGDDGKSGKPRRAGSLGLGLYIARAVVSAHGGTLTVESSAAAGTRFTARLPRNA